MEVEITHAMIVFLMAIGFIAAFVDSVVGGGGLITIPGLLMAGLPPQLALGTNKFASSWSSLTSTVSFLRSGHAHPRLLRVFVPLSFFGAALGAFLVQRMKPEFLRPLVVGMLVLIGIYTFFKKGWGAKGAFAGPTQKTWLAGAALALVLGTYDGFFGPGTGSFLIFGFLLLGFDFLGAAANSKVLNLASNVGALVVFALAGSVNYRIAIPMAVSMIAGAYVGTQVAIRKGAGYVRPLFLTVVTLLLGKQIWTLLCASS